MIRVFRSKGYYVSMLVYNPTDPNPPTKRIEWLRTLLSASLPLTLFIDDMFRRALEGAGWFSEANHPEVQLIDWSLEESDVWKKCESVSLRLPEIRNEEKDGAFFLKLMNAKAELVARVAEGGSERFVEFLDAGIVGIANTGGGRGDSSRMLESRSCGARGVGSKDILDVLWRIFRNEEGGGEEILPGSRRGIS